MLNDHFEERDLHMPKEEVEDGSSDNSSSLERENQMPIVNNLDNDDNKFKRSVVVEEININSVEQVRCEIQILESPSP
jgi:hypothetical protein